MNRTLAAASARIIAGRHGTFFDGDRRGVIRTLPAHATALVRHLPPPSSYNAPTTRNRARVNREVHQ